MGESSTTRVATLSLQGDGVLRLVYAKGAVVTVADAEEETAAVARLTARRKVPWLIDIRHIEHADRDARIRFATAEAAGLAVVDQVSCAAQESLLWVEDVSSNLRHPGLARIDADACDVHGTGLQLDDEEDEVPDRAKDAQRLDGEEVAGVERLPVAAEELLPRSLAIALWRRFESGLCE